MKLRSIEASEAIEASIDCIYMHTYMKQAYVVAILLAASSLPSFMPALEILPLFFLKKATIV